MVLQTRAGDRGTEGWGTSATDPWGPLQLWLPILASVLPEMIEHSGSAVRKDNRPILSLIHGGICLSVTGIPEFHKITFPHLELRKNDLIKSKLSREFNRLLNTLVYTVSNYKTDYPI